MRVVLVVGRAAVCLSPSTVHYFGTIKLLQGGIHNEKLVSFLLLQLYLFSAGRDPDWVVTLLPTLT